MGSEFRGSEILHPAARKRWIVEARKAITIIDSTCSTKALACHTINSYEGYGGLKKDGKKTMTMPTLSASTSVSSILESKQNNDAISDDLRTMKALRILLESRLINATEYQRRLESFKKRLEDAGSQTE